ncbi:TPA: nucleotidyltransferase domain-containing protein [Candidatus Poribacteria bacterium]|nr:nucleotidyltransferase domain-containing protein [Candidatus Poribacteria bacterium]
MNRVNNYPIPTIESLKEDISALKELLEKTEAVGVTGSLAHGCFKKWTSDIDFFVIQRVSVSDKERDEMRSALQKLAWERYGRGADVLFYTLRGLKAIPSWYTVIMASDGVLLHDKGRVKKIFHRIVSLAQKKGLVHKFYDGQPVWEMGRPMKPGEIISLKLEDDENDQR